MPTRSVPLQEKVSVVIGGRSGLGTISVRRFVEAGAQVYAVDVTSSVGAGAPADQRHIDIDTMSFDQLARMLTVSLPAVITAAGLGVPLLRRVVGSSVIYTASMALISTHPSTTAHAASRSEVVGFTRSAAELDVHNIRVDAVLPGPIHRPLILDDFAGDYLSKPSDSNTLRGDRLPAACAAVALLIASDASSRCHRRRPLGRRQPESVTADVRPSQRRWPRTSVAVVHHNHEFVRAAVAAAH